MINKTRMHIICVYTVTQQTYCASDLHPQLPALSAVSCFKL